MVKSDDERDEKKAIKKPRTVNFKYSATPIKVHLMHFVVNAETLFFELGYEHKYAMCLHYSKTLFLVSFFFRSFAVASSSLSTSSSCSPSCALAGFKYVECVNNKFKFPAKLNDSFKFTFPFSMNVS